MSYSSVRTRINEYFREHGRHTLPWRRTHNPYRILVSEMMLQQTQVERVIPFYRHFLKKFPTVHVLARAPLGDVLRAWQGLGYNRRAQFLHNAARAVMEVHGGRMPKTYEKLLSLPGVGKYTAKAIRVFAYNEMEVLIETNVRSVVLHHFFKNGTHVSDTTLLPTIEQLVAGQDPRTFYAALMDYGTYLKKTYGNPNKKSIHHKKQKPFRGSIRFVRGSIIRILATQHAQTRVDLARTIRDERLEMVLKTLLREGLIREEKKRYVLA